MLGFPALYYRDEFPPLVRLGRVLGANYSRVFTSCKTEGGDSGGPLFNLAGELVGISGLVQSETHGSGHVSVDLYLQIRPQLLAGKLVEEAGLTGPFEDTQGLTSLADPSHRSVVVVLSGGKPVALGLIVAADGWIVTKASELSGGIVCQLSDGRRLEAAVEGRSWKHDLALLRVAASDLPAAAWSERDPTVGQVVASVGSQPRPLNFGVVATPALNIPRERGQLALNVKPAEPGTAGVRINEVWPGKPQTGRVVQAGDLVTHIEDTPTPSTAEFARARDQHLNAPKAIVGETIQLTLQRAGRTLKVKVPIESEGMADERFFWEYLGRKTGFPTAFVHDGLVSRNQCGSPLVDPTGKVVAVNIAKDFVGMYAIPGAVVRKVVEELRLQRAADRNR